MEQPNLQNLKYGILYIYSDSERMPELHQAKSLLAKFVHPMTIEWRSNPGSDSVWIAARRFNVGNIGQYATVSMRLTLHRLSGIQSVTFHDFVDVLMDVGDPDSGDVVIGERVVSFNFDASFEGGFADYCTNESDLPMPTAAPQDKTRVEKENRHRFEFGKRLKNAFKKESKSCVDEIVCSKLEEPKGDLIQEEEDLELAKLERDRKEALERIRRDIVNYIARYHDDPKVLMAELLRGKVVVGHPGRLLVNGDMKIVLPEYDELEIEMPAMCRTLYILFMKQRKQGCGIVLRNIDEFRDEMIDIYGLVKPGANERRVERSINNLCDPYGESLNQTISRINRCVKNVIIDKDLAKDYLILGNRGEAYSIGLDPEYLELPRAVTGA